MIYEERVRAIAEEMQKNDNLLTKNSWNLTWVFIPAARIAVKHMEEYAAQEVQQVKEERHKAVELLKLAYEIAKRANDYLYSDASSISDATSRDLYHFIGNDGPEIEEFLNSLNDSK